MESLAIRPNNVGARQHGKFHSRMSPILQLIQSQQQQNRSQQPTTSNQQQNQQTSANNASNGKPTNQYRVNLVSQLHDRDQPRAMIFNVADKDEAQVSFCNMITVNRAVWYDISDDHMCMDCSTEFGKYDVVHEQAQTAMHLKLGCPTF